MSVSPGNNIPELLQRLEREGQPTAEITNWRKQAIGAILLRTGSDTRYLVEPMQNAPSLITRITKTELAGDDARPPWLDKIIRHEGNPDSELRVGQPVDILGLSRRSAEFDPDSIFTITPLVEIKYLHIETQP